MNILFACGGTGGHIYAAVALYEEMKRRDPKGRHTYLFVGSDYGLERDIFSQEDITQTRFISSRGLQRRLTPGNLKSLFLNIRALSQARRVFAAFAPDLVVGTGGYPAYHMTRLARKKGTPYDLVEMNAVPGLVTKWFYRNARAVYAASTSLSQYLPGGRVTVTGAPLRRCNPTLTRADILDALGLLPDRKTILIIGGSCGSEAINRAAEGLVKSLTPGCQLIWATGTRAFDAVSTRVIPPPPHVKLVPYIGNMPDVLSVADLIVSRAGAMTVQEIQSHHLPAVLVPFAQAAGRHQHQNALELADRQVAQIIEESDITPTALRRAIDSILLDEKRLADIAASYAAWDSRDGAAHIVTQWLAQETCVC